MKDPLDIHQLISFTYTNTFQKEMLSVTFETKLNICWKKYKWKQWNIAVMVLQKMSIVLFELTEEMEYEVKRRFKGKVWAKPRKNNFIIQRYFTRKNYLGWLVAQ